MLTVGDHLVTLAPDALLEAQCERLDARGRGRHALRDQHALRVPYC